MSATYYDFTVGVNSSFDVNAVGGFIYYLDGAAGGMSERIIVRNPSSGLAMVLYPGQSFQLPETAKVGSNWKIENADKQATIKGTVVIGAGRFMDSRIAGAVSVVDGGRERTESGSALILMQNTSGGAATYAQMALINPTGSGKNVFLSQLILSVSVGGGNVTGSIGLGYGNSLANGPQASRAKKGSAGAGAAVMRYDAGAGGVASTHLLQFMPANQPIAYKPTEPYLIEPGYGFIIGHGVQNSTMTGMFDVFEQRI